MNEKKYFLASAAVTLASAAVLLATAKRKPKKKVIHASLILAGVAGFAGAAALAYQPHRAAKKRLMIEDILDDIEVEELEDNIAEILGGISDTVTD